MFGYVTAYKPELKMKDFYKYKAYYCGLCRTLKERYGRLGQMTLTYDMTFLIILLNSLYEYEMKKEQKRCIVHPVQKHDMLQNRITEYAADMNIALSYHHMLDDWNDESSIVGLAGARILKRRYKKIQDIYPNQCEAIVEALKKLQEYEKSNETNLDLVAGCFGSLMEELFLYKKDQWEPYLRRLGFFLGKFIYLIDAYEDLEDDIKKDNYNPYKSICQGETFESDCKEILTMMMAECTSEFEKLPCILDVDILRNILYEGVFSKFNTLQSDKCKRKELEYDNGSI